MSLERTIPELLKGLGSVLTSGVGAYLALHLKDLFDRRGQSRTADLDEYKKVSSLLTDRVIAALDSSDFLAGTPRAEFWQQLNDLIVAYEGNRELIFHDQQLNADFHALRKITTEFVTEVSRLTVTEGNPPQFTTRPRANRVYPTDESRRQNAEEANVLDQAARQLGSRSRKFIDQAKRRLRT
ncbi:hypothetical protein P0D87_15875 [Paraburkholderia sp. RL17-368-BIF-A]|uniref:hypothetical protein n=1 Tax=Paraburkholderia sp. RL17-368-BIF-A TaxID=3031628 RepID=UPI0038C09792